MKMRWNIEVYSTTQAGIVEALEEVINNLRKGQAYLNSASSNYDLKSGPGNDASEDEFRAQTRAAMPAKSVSWNYAK